MDEYGEGLPVGWMISNRENTTALNAFFTAIKQACGNIKPLWFMSDDAQQYFNAWKGGTENKKKIICTWHIHRSWRRALHEHIKTKEDQITIHHSLCVLLQEHKEQNFRTLLQALLTHLHNTHEKFYNYFNSTYCSRLEEWAVCYRKGCTVNTNMFAESFHRVLNVVYLNHKKNRRINLLLMTLMKVARNKAFERFRKLETGKIAHRICEIMKRHQTALTLFPTSVTPKATNHAVEGNLTNNRKQTVRSKKA